MVKQCKCFQIAEIAEILGSCIKGHMTYSVICPRKQRISGSPFIHNWIQWVGTAEQSLVKYNDDSGTYGWYPRLRTFIKNDKKTLTFMSPARTRHWEVKHPIFFHGVCWDIQRHWTKFYLDRVWWDDVVSWSLRAILLILTLTLTLTLTCSTKCARNSTRTLDQLTPKLGTQTRTTTRNELP